MPGKSTLSDLRSAIDQINKDIIRERGIGEASNKEVLDRVKALQADAIKELTPQLVHMALTKLYNDVSSRKGPKSLNNFGIDLFGEYHGIPQLVTLKPGIKKVTTQLTFAEADLLLNPGKPKHEDSRNAVLSRIVEDCRPYMRSTDDTLELAMERRREAKNAEA